MNQRIDQLWAQALDLAVPETHTRLSLSQVLKIKQVFADMIVAECAEVVYSRSGHATPQDLYEHFGVEE